MWLIYFMLGVIVTLGLQHIIEVLKRNKIRATINLIEDYVWEKEKKEDACCDCVEYPCPINCVWLKEN